jgi:hypothetical protein
MGGRRTRASSKRGRILITQIGAQQIAPLAAARLSQLVAIEREAESNSPWRPFVAGIDQEVAEAFKPGTRDPARRMRWRKHDLAREANPAAAIGKCVPHIRETGLAALRRNAGRPWQVPPSWRRYRRLASAAGDPSMRAKASLAWTYRSPCRARG